MKFPQQNRRPASAPRTAPRLVGLGLLTLLWGSLPSAQAADVDAEAAQALQQSYDREGAGKLIESLSALDGLPAARQATYMAQLRRGWLLYRIGRYADSIEAYQRAITAAPRAIEPRVGVLLPQTALRRYSDVEAQARAVLAVDPHNYLATLRLAFAYYNSGRFTEAATLYAQLKELYPSDAEVRSGLGWSLLKAGKSAEASRELRELLSIQPRHALAKQGLELLPAAR